LVHSIPVYSGGVFAEEENEIVEIGTDVVALDVGAGFHGDGVAGLAFEISGEGPELDDGVGL
jgi:hypothetical protein